MNLSFINKKIFSKLNLIISRPVVNMPADRKMLFDVYSKMDYTRTMMLNLICNELIENSVTGEMAEVGVFQGKFSRLMSLGLPDKKIYLYDTFKGFDESFFKTEFEQKIKTKSVNDFNNTSLDMVLSNMPFRQNCIVRQGFFPDSVQESDKLDRFCLVSLDCDLYAPILAGLEFFYPKMTKGGYILIHDYTNAKYKDCKTAVQEFCRKNKINFVPIPDGWGTAVIAI